MKIMHVMYQVNIGGIESIVMNIFREMHQRAEFVFLVYKQDKFDYEDEIERLGGKIIRISQPRANNRIKHIKELLSVLKTEKPDVVHCHTYYDSASVLYAAKKAGVRERIAHSHTTESFNMFRNMIHSVMRKSINKNATKKIACSKEAGESLFGKNAEFEIVQNGISTDKFMFNEQKRMAIRKQLKIGENEVVIGHIGRFADVKNHKLMIEIADSLRKRKYSFQMLLIGDGDTHDDIAKMINEKKLCSKVKLLGNQMQANSFLSAFDVFLLPSKYEGLSIALIEAEINGLPSVISEAVPPEAIINDNILRASIYESPDTWANLIIKISKQRRRPSYNGIKKYSLERLIEKMERIYGIRGSCGTISIIIPAYNASSYIGRCIESAIAQTYENIEIIVVDDGSTDNTQEIVREYMHRDTRIRLLTQNNSGPSVARIKGAKSATGDYVIFVDSDDYISERAVEKIAAGFVDNEVDSVKFCGVTVPGEEEIGRINSKDAIIDKEKKMELLLFSDSFSTLCLQAFKKDAFNDIVMPKKKITYCEDYLLSFMLHRNIETTLFIDEILYYYCDNNCSTTRTKNIAALCKNVEDRMMVSRIMTEYVLGEYRSQGGVKNSAFVVYQIDRIRRDFIKLVSQSDIRKNDFLEFANKILASDDYVYMRESIDANEIEKYLKDMPFMRRIRNGYIIRAIYRGDVEKLWWLARLRRRGHK